MKIGIDIRTACGKKAGKGWYTYHLVQELLKMDRENEYILYTNQLAPELAHLHHAHIKLITARGIFWHFAVIMDFVKEVGGRGGAKKSALFFAPTSFIIPAFLPKNIPSVVTVHDLVAFLPRHGGAAHQAKATFVEHLFIKKVLRKAGRIVVPSENTKRDIIRLFKYAAEKIAVTPLAADERFFDHVVTPEMRAAIHSKYNLPEKFILTVGGFEPRKNLGRLIDATMILAKKIPALKLVVIGGKNWKSGDHEKRVAAAVTHVIHIEHCDAEELATLYRLASVFIFPSLYEGFGLPPLEAMASGCPVVCSKTSSLPEVCGDAALLVNPESAQEIAEATGRVLENDTLRAELIKKGLPQARTFSWRKTAALTLEAFKKAI